MAQRETPETSLARNALALADTFGHGATAEEIAAEARIIIEQLQALPHSPVWFAARALADWILLMATSGSVAREKYRPFALEKAEQLRGLLHVKEHAA